MKAFNTTYIAAAMLLTTLLSFTCQAEEPQLPLSGKSLTVYPIVLARPDTAIDEEMQKFGERIAEVVGLTLEQHGMLAGVSAHYPETIVPDDLTTLTGLVTKLRLGSVTRSRCSL